MKNRRSLDLCLALVCATFGARLMFLIAIAALDGMELPLGTQVAIAVLSAAKAPLDIAGGRQLIVIATAAAAAAVYAAGRQALALNDAPLAEQPLTELS
jgi:hypothetical protein